MLYIDCPAPRIVHMGWWSKTDWAPRLRSPSKWCCIIKMMCKPCFGEPQKRKIWHFLKSNNRSGLQSGPWVAWPESTGGVLCPAPQICLLEDRNVENWYLGRNLHTEVFRHPCPSGSWPLCGLQLQMSLYSKFLGNLSTWWMEHSTWKPLGYHGCPVNVQFLPLSECFSDIYWVFALPSVLGWLIIKKPESNRASLWTYCHLSRFNLQQLTFFFLASI